MKGIFVKATKTPPDIIVNGRPLSKEEALTVCTCIETAAYMFTQAEVNLPESEMPKELHDQLQTELVCLRTLFKCR